MLKWIKRKMEKREYIRRTNELRKVARAHWSWEEPKPGSRTENTCYTEKEAAKEMATPDQEELIARGFEREKFQNLN